MSDNRLYRFVIYTYGGEEFQVGEPMTKAEADYRFTLLGEFINPGPLSWIRARNLQYATNPGYANLPRWEGLMPGDVFTDKAALCAAVAAWAEVTPPEDAHVLAGWHRLTEAMLVSLGDVERIPGGGWRVLRFPEKRAVPVVLVEEIGELFEREGLGRKEAERIIREGRKGLDRRDLGL